MKKSAVIVLVVFAIFILIILFGRLLQEEKNDSNNMALFRVIRGSIKIEVNATGELDSSNSVAISSELTEETKIVYIIEDGSRVSTGDMLVRLDASGLEQKATMVNSQKAGLLAEVKAQQQTLAYEKSQVEKEIKNSEFDYKVLAFELEKIRKGDGPIELARLEAAAMEANKQSEEMEQYIQDLEGLLEKGFSNTIELEQARQIAAKLKKAADAAQKQYDNYQKFLFPALINAAQSKVDKASMIITQTRRGADFRIGKAQADLERCQREYEDAVHSLNMVMQQLAKAEIMAPRSGLIVLRETYVDGQLRKPKIGDTVYQNQPLLYLPDITSIIVRVLVREIDLHKIVVGSKAQIFIDAYPDRSYAGKIDSIGALAERRIDIRSGEKYFKVIISLLDEDDTLRPGMTARANIQGKDRSENVLTIPASAVFRDVGKHFCYFMEPSGQISKKEITIGLQNDEMVEVVEGLEEGDIVSLSEPPFKGGR